MASQRGPGRGKVAIILDEMASDNIDGNTKYHLPDLAPTLCRPVKTSYEEFIDGTT